MTYKKLGDLKDDEIKAARAFGSDSGHHHRIAQGIRDCDCIKGYAKFQNNACIVTRAISNAIKKLELTKPMTVCSGIGWGRVAVGSLTSQDLSKFVGLTYQYPGFISTSDDAGIAERFIRNGYKVCSDRPLLFVFNLPTGFNVLPMKELGADNSYEHEFLLDRNLEFEIKDVTTYDLEKVAEKVWRITVKP